LGQTLALLEQSGISSEVAGGVQMEAEPQAAQQMLPQGMPEVTIALPSFVEDALGEQAQQPLSEAGESQERAQQLAGFLQAAMLVPTPVTLAPAPVAQAGEPDALVTVAALGPAPAVVVADGADDVLIAADQQAMTTEGQPETSVRADRPAMAVEHQPVTVRGVETQRPVLPPQQAANEAHVVAGLQSEAQLPTAEQQVATEPAVRMDMARAATVAAAAEGKPLVMEVPAAPKGNAPNVAQVRFAQPTNLVAASAQPEQQRQQGQGQLGQQQAGLANSNASAVTLVEQPEEAALFQVQMTAATDLETPHGHSMGVTIQRMAGGQLEVQAAEPAKVAAEAQLMRQVTDRLESHDLKQGTDRISLRLSPEHLGNLQLNLRMEDQQVRVEIVAENRAVREALLQQVDQLKETLSRQNIKMESCDVTTANNGGLTQQQPGAWRQGASERRPLYAQQYGAGRNAGVAGSGTDAAMQYFAPQYQSTLDVRF
jgi:flagellar hook-length control protein FliK